MNERIQITSLVVLLFVYSGTCVCVTACMKNVLCIITILEYSMHRALSASQVEVKFALACSVNAVMLTSIYMYKSCHFFLDSSDEIIAKNQ